MKLYVKASESDNIDIAAILKAYKHYWCGKVKYNNIGVVEIAPDNDGIRGCSIEYLKNKLSGYTTEQLLADLDIVSDAIDEHEAYCDTWSASESYNETKNYLLSLYGLATSKPADIWFDANMNTLLKIYDIASEPSTFAPRLSNEERKRRIKQIVKLSSNEVVLGGGQYGGGIAWEILEGSGIDGRCVWNNYRMTPEERNSDKIIQAGVLRVQNYLNALGITNEYNSRRKSIICDRDGFINN